MFFLPEVSVPVATIAASGCRVAEESTAEAIDWVQSSTRSVLLGSAVVLDHASEHIMNIGWKSLRAPVKNPGGKNLATRRFPAISFLHYTSLLSLTCAVPTIKSKPCNSVRIWVWSASNVTHHRLQVLYGVRMLHLPSFCTPTQFLSHDILYLWQNIQGCFGVEEGESHTARDNVDDGLSVFGADGMDNLTIDKGQSWR
jgi:hypothetical protein